MCWDFSLSFFLASEGGREGGGKKKEKHTKFARKLSLMLFLFTSCKGEERSADARGWKGWKGRESWHMRFASLSKLLTISLLLYVHKCDVFVVNRPTTHARRKFLFPSPPEFAQFFCHLMKSQILPNKKLIAWIFMELAHRCWFFLQLEFSLSFDGKEILNLNFFFFFGVSKFSFFSLRRRIFLFAFASKTVSIFSSSKRLKETPNFSSSFWTFQCSQI